MHSKPCEEAWPPRALDTEQRLTSRMTHALRQIQKRTYPGTVNPIVPWSKFEPITPRAAWCPPYRSGNGTYCTRKPMRKRDLSALNTRRASLEWSENNSIESTNCEKRRKVFALMTQSRGWLVEPPAAGWYCPQHSGGSIARHDESNRLSHRNQPCSPDTSKSNH